MDGYRVHLFQYAKNTHYWTADKRLLRYLNGMIDLSLVYADPNPLKGFVNADWGNCLVDTGYTFVLRGHSRSKHIDLRHHFIRDALHSGHQMHAHYW
ncbi:hypothetical protein ALC56_07464 [Trachymyrmex septentrionalis]|uniref:Copia protein n=1 Tax=Trachymyrmex septentrionalis TaxID=34720 RepID=A0A151JVW0_9HYME|nr:hypothetical protein ALC56_07464 [Trachymyrmex septentrionalis]